MCASNKESNSANDEPRSTRSLGSDETGANDPPPARGTRDTSGGMSTDSATPPSPNKGASSRPEAAGSGAPDMEQPPANPPAAGAGERGGSQSPTGEPDPCAELAPNDTIQTAVPFDLDKVVTSCIGEEYDVDYYSITSPAAEGANGYYLASLTNTGEGNMELEVYVASDGGRVFDGRSAARGAPINAYWAAAAAQTFYVKLRNYAAFPKPFTYKLQLEYIAIEDDFEPNDTRTEAKPIALGAPVQAFAFAGFKKTELDASGYTDWYSVTAANPGKMTVKIEAVPTEIQMGFQAYNPDGSPLGGVVWGMGRAVNATFTYDATMSGEHLIEVMIYGVWAPRGSALTAMYGEVPYSFEHPYKLVVTQP